ncbi:uncharacterized protein LOC126686648 [Mercurialis annua]|uniref:uncharacterized protein LOC126686648 n=1 Tax=Mercurialis annua TaxID=3986 RepID=UPI00215FC91E|nr:uncharacterized protein LOC126686648 [Mercurialis annua]
MALKLHPDKNPNDPNARANFQKLLSSYEILKDPRTRKQFDDLLRLKRQRKTGYGFGLKNSKPPEKASPPDSAHHPSQTCGLAAAAAMLQKIARFLEIVEIVVRIIVTVLEEFKNLEEPAKKKSGWQWGGVGVEKLSPSPSPLLWGILIPVPIYLMGFNSSPSPYP